LVTYKDIIKRKSHPKTPVKILFGIAWCVGAAVALAPDLLDRAALVNVGVDVSIDTGLTP
jgi:hypothetical protein